MTQTGADALARILSANGIDTCFANPGTTEMHLVAALSRDHSITSHLCLFEGVATGAADGFARMARRPACTLLHLGPGLANGLANLHNARKAATPVLNIVGEHALPHIAHDAPLTADIAGLARPVSKAVATPKSTANIATLTTTMLEEIQTAPMGVGTLIMPNDIAWGEVTPGNPVPVAVPAPALPSPDAVAEAARALGEPGALFILGAPHITARAVALAHGIAAATGARLLGEAAIARLSRGGDVPLLTRIPFQIDAALAELKNTTHAVLAGARAPVAFFAYPGRPSALLPQAAQTHTLCPPESDLEAALEALATAVGADAAHAPAALPALIDGAITPESLGPAIAHALPEHAIVADESVTNGAHLYPACAGAPAHDWINNRGGSIGYSMPLAVGCAAACPDRPVLAVVGDGSASYTPQALWTMARSKMNVTVVILSNRRYRILANEMSNIGAGEPDARSDPLLSLEDPAIGWVELAQGYGVPGQSVSDAAALSKAVAKAMAQPGPQLIEAVMV
ncbi:acetolactate synthase large subunit [Aquicoccus sp. G2-2]|uniref:acetolactate synthase large subunit n=1 Tax=Aquicoccus sp. G2-2 TaxID=3092120 RepID=UPI002ADF0C7F|nr:acetolactate synthase large subunit [Aquicoccus sp. G2-2]MEA1113776.1 acetolactate synthase large subunit [Aquicoccus sp. G2-2]